MREEQSGEEKKFEVGIALTGGAHPTVIAGYIFLKLVLEEKKKILLKIFIFF